MWTDTVMPHNYAMKEKTPAKDDESVWDYATGVLSLVRHDPSARYYARSQVGGKRKMVALKTEIQSVAKLKLANESAKAERLCRTSRSNPRPARCGGREAFAPHEASAAGVAFWHGNCRTDSGRPIRLASVFSPQRIFRMDDLDLGQPLRGFGAGQRSLPRFPLTRMLGRGGMGVAWPVHDERLEVDVALKFPPKQVANDLGTVSDLKRETRLSLQFMLPHALRLWYWSPPG